MSKFYKLAKSNETSAYIISQRIDSLKETTIDKYINLILDSIIAVISCFLSVFINIESVTSESKIKAIIMILVTLLVIFAILNYSIKFIIKLINNTKDNKKDSKSRQELKNYFYTKILNDIGVGLSLYEKYNTDKSSNSSKMYFYESFYYFELSMSEIKDINLVETVNPNREVTTIFYEMVNKNFLCDLFNQCVNILSQISIDAREMGDEDLERDAKRVSRYFRNLINNVEMQCNN